MQTKVLMIKYIKYLYCYEAFPVALDAQLNDSLQHCKHLQEPAASSSAIFTNYLKKNSSTQVSA